MSISNELPQMSVFLSKPKDSEGLSGLSIVLTTLLITKWQEENPNLEVTSGRQIDILANLTDEEKLTFLQMCKVSAVAKGLDAIIRAFNSVCIQTIEKEIAGSDSRLRGKLAMDIMLKMFGPDIVKLLVSEYAATYPITGERSGVALHQEAKAETAPFAPASEVSAAPLEPYILRSEIPQTVGSSEHSATPPAEEPRVLRPGVAETVSEGENVRTEGGRKLHVDENFA